MNNYEPLSLTKADVIDALYERIGCSRREAEQMVETILEAMKQSLERHEDVKISGFGTFRVLHKNARKGRNPRTKEEMTIRERHVVSFRTSQLLRDALNPERRLRRNKRDEQ